MQRHLSWPSIVVAVGVVLVVALCATACSGGPPLGYVSSVEFDDKWPLTVDEGVLECTTHASYGLSRGPEVRHLQDERRHGLRRQRHCQRPRQPGHCRHSEDKLLLHKVEVEPPSRLSEEERKAIFAASVGCEDDADKKSQAAFPDPAHFKQQLALHEKLTDQCKAALKKQHKLTEEEHDAISSEGVSLGWPPLEPMRVSVSPLIERGLKLCDQ